MERKTFRRLGWSLAAVGLFWGGTSLAVGYFMENDTAGLMGNAFFSTGVSLFRYAAAILLLRLMLRRLPALPKPARSRLPFADFMGYFCASRGIATILALVGALAYLLVALLLNSPRDIMAYFEEMNPLITLSAGTWLTLFLIVIVAPIAEEYMFRGLLLAPLRPFGDTVAILYSGVAFGLLHMHIQQIPYAAAIGMILGYLMVRTEDIRLCIALHGAINLTSVVMLPFLSKLTESVTVLHAVWFYISLLMMASVIGLVLFFTNLKRVRLLPPRCAFSEPVRAGMILPVAVPYVAVCLAMAVWAAKL